MLIEDELKQELSGLEAALFRLLYDIGQRDAQERKAQEHLARLHELLIDLMEEPQ